MREQHCVPRQSTGSTTDSTEGGFPNKKRKHETPLLSKLSEKLAREAAYRAFSGRSQTSQLCMVDSLRLANQVSQTGSRKKKSNAGKVPEVSLDAAHIISDATAFVKNTNLQAPVSVACLEYLEDHLHSDLAGIHYQMQLLLNKRNHIVVALESVQNQLVKANEAESTVAFADASPVAGGSSDLMDTQQRPSYILPKECRLLFRPRYSPLYSSHCDFLTALGDMWELADSLGTTPIASEVLVKYPPFLMFRDRLDTSSIKALIEELWELLPERDTAPEHERTMLPLRPVDLGACEGHQ
ncbi:hypothetical protein DL96DRAFT_1773886 [Flagelloscypha sp. PMI_526]|nr:hypothetical protein DL96DRAFT_1773886 [Flagelloscypha sp. PMI_526]